jgi:glutathione S-transferase
MTLTFFEFSGSRSDRVLWALQELDVVFERRNDQGLFGSDELKAVHPQGKLPAIMDDGRPLFESAAICTWLADKHADKGLCFASGTWERALHDQWTAFVLSELEAHLWIRARNTFIYEKGDRLKAVFEQADKEAVASIATLDTHLSANEYMVAGQFSVTDIITGFATNWAQSTGVTGDAPHVEAYNARLRERPNYPVEKT